MWGFKINLLEGLLLIILILLMFIISFPCWLLQRFGFKVKQYSNFLYKNNQYLLLDIKRY
ncbi:hypothetical protein PBI_PBS1_31 [Bacillus phage PBS1]|uniref:Uncharacterized protein n=1 Tax=Bacillus phage PBS1 TaxID=2884423 RepID=A0A223LCT2_BPPB1|nr:hypothetical protein FK780_gp031 [Bacillus phage PBS1]AST99853.1 hypothetical protein PBI_PBS1_31 [Bacillus phage PBS1]BDE75327.1 hypothetical protein [Bacillus phage PBS1]